MWLRTKCAAALVLLFFGLSCSQKANSVLTESPFTLIRDDSFNYQLLVQFGTVRYHGASVADLFSAVQAIKPKSMSSYNSSFYQLAQQSEKRAEATNDTSVAQDSYFSASNYYRQADFYLHDNWSDPLIDWYWEKQATLFDKAIASLPVPGERVTIPADGFETIGIFYKPDNHSIKRPTVLIGSGYDEAQEHSLHSNGLAFLEKGWNVLTYEGPGQPTVRRQQNLGFIYDWEKVVTPTVDYLANRSDVDMSQLVLQGNSMGGYLAARAAAFEPRVKALILNEGVYSVYEGFTHGFPSSLLELLAAGNTTAFDKALEEGVLFNDSASTTNRWAITQGLWSFNTHSPSEWIEKSKNMTLANITQLIRVPVWVSNPVNDTTFPGQAVKAAQALGSKATIHNFTGAASLHCSAGAYEEANWAILSWLDGVFSSNHSSTSG
jgi:pimeloyl-ACP methyl ester carboxylesterase